MKPLAKAYQEYLFTLGIEATPSPQQNQVHQHYHCGAIAAMGLVGEALAIPDTIKRNAVIFSLYSEIMDYVDNEINIPNHEN